ncbi:MULTISPECIES: GNAT family N-acetyltransferase [Deefgea]|uniref:GNAT family N-acetyltransferase n=1 Tax=Deefgea chitinilytica TaxID=570276 RepID=A0ABS2CD02_9NEIS|nr:MULTISPECIES: GNAT family N-acetyltransferase [Deefgea]MBM5572023.1 GNAT family N-acetyltransferase [Deefgea chitinilytica]MBM9889258.1 N-acetyltransferase [Deefgea sp. CFH1-16]
MQWQYRLANAADLPQIVAIYNSTIASRQVTADTEPVSLDSRQAWFAAHQRPDRPLWVVEQAGVIVGWLSFSSFYGRPAYQGTAEVSIYLAESVRGQGLGQFLLQSAIDFAPSIALHTLLGFVFGHNTPSVKLFERFGFARWGHLPCVAELDGIERDLLIFGLRV